ncbi:MAG: hypothetical protein ABIH72_01625 [archaeon]
MVFKVEVIDYPSSDELLNSDFVLAGNSIQVASSLRVLELDPSRDIRRGVYCPNISNILEIIKGCEIPEEACLGDLNDSPSAVYLDVENNKIAGCTAYHDGFDKASLLDFQATVFLRDLRGFVDVLTPRGVDKLDNLKYAFHRYLGLRTEFFPVTEEDLVRFNSEARDKQVESFKKVPRKSEPECAEFFSKVFDEAYLGWDTFLYFGDSDMDLKFTDNLRELTGKTCRTVMIPRFSLEEIVNVLDEVQISKSTIVASDIDKTFLAPKENSSVLDSVFVRALKDFTLDVLGYCNEQRLRDSYFWLSGDKCSRVIKHDNCRVALAVLLDQANLVEYQYIDRRASFSSLLFTSEVTHNMGKLGKIVAEAKEYYGRQEPILLPLYREKEAKATHDALYSGELMYNRPLAEFFHLISNKVGFLALISDKPLQSSAPIAKGRLIGNSILPELIRKLH